MLEMFETKLPRAWKWYAHVEPDAANYAQGCVLLGEIDSMANFLRHWNHIPSADLLKNHQVLIAKRAVRGYAFFCQNIRPEWEDSVNVRGGEFVLRVTDNIRHVFDTLITDCLNGTSPFVGIRCMCNKLPMKIEMWHDEHASHTEMQHYLKSQLANVTGLSPIKHKTHKDIYVTR